MIDPAAMSDEELAACDAERSRRWNVQYEAGEAEREEKLRALGDRVIPLAIAALGEKTLDGSETDMVARILRAAIACGDEEYSDTRLGMLCTAYWLWTEGLSYEDVRAHPLSAAGYYYAAFARAIIAIHADDQIGDMLDPEYEIYLEHGSTIARHLSEITTDKAS